MLAIRHLKEVAILSMVNDRRRFLGFRGAISSPKSRSNPMTTQPATKQFLPALQRSATSAFLPVQREFNRLFDELSSGWNAFTELDMMPRIDVRDTKKAIEVTVELPGIAQEDIKIDVDDDVLTISGEKKSEKETNEDDLRVSERSYGAFSRSISLPRSVDTDKIQATISNGVLKVVAPKDGSATAKSIKIQSAK
jgi:HSP20 family protein